MNNLEDIIYNILSVNEDLSLKEVFACLPNKIDYDIFRDSVCKLLDNGKIKLNKKLKLERS